MHQQAWRRDQATPLSTTLLKTQKACSWPFRCHKTGKDNWQMEWMNKNWKDFDRLEWWVTTRKMKFNMGKRLSGWVPWLYESPGGMNICREKKSWKEHVNSNSFSWRAGQEHQREHSMASRTKHPRGPSSLLPMPTPWCLYSTQEANNNCLLDLLPTFLSEKLSNIKKFKYYNEPSQVYPHRPTAQPLFRLCECVCVCVCVCMYPEYMKITWNTSVYVAWPPRIITLTTSNNSLITSNIQSRFKFPQPARNIIYSFPFSPWTRLSFPHYTGTPVFLVLDLSGFSFFGIIYQFPYQFPCPISDNLEGSDCVFGF